MSDEHSALVTLRGAGCRITAYFIDEQILGELMSTPTRKALYEDNPFSLVANLALHTIRIAQGFCIYKAGDQACKLLIDNQLVEIELVGYVDDGYAYEEIFSASLERALVAYFQDVEPLQEDKVLELNQLLIIELEDFKLGELSSYLTSKAPIKVRDLKLGVVDLDYDSELSRATYQLGLTIDIEKDIRYLIHKDQRYDFELEILNGYSSTFYLVRRKPNGAWTAKCLS